MRVCILCSVRFWQLIFEMYCTVGVCCWIVPEKRRHKKNRIRTSLMTLGREGGKEDKIEEPSTTSTIQFLFFVAHVAKLPFTTLCTVDDEWISSSGRMVKGIRNSQWSLVLCCFVLRKFHADCLVRYRLPLVRNLRLTARAVPQHGVSASHCASGQHADR